jgi:hypothetical protein
MSQILTKMRQVTPSRCRKTDSGLAPALGPWLESVGPLR